MGSTLGGWSLHLHRGRLRYVHNYLGKERHVLDSDDVVPPGPHDLAFTFAREGDFRGRGRLLVDGEVVGQGEIPEVTPVRYSITGGGITCGWEQGPAVGDDYAAPFRFTGRLRRVVVEVDGTPYRDPDAEVEAILSEQ
jgi:arylsulfatase